MDVEEYVRLIKAEDEYFFRTLSGFEHNSSYFSFDMTPEILEILRNGSICCSLNLGTKCQRYRRTFWNSWITDGSEEYSPSCFHHGCLGNTCAGGHPFVDMTRSCWARIWENIIGKRSDISFIQNTCKKYNISILYPTHQYEQKYLNSRGQSAKTVFTQYYVLLVKERDTNQKVKSLREEKLFELSETVYKRMSGSEIVRKIASTIRKTPWCSVYQNKYVFSVFEDKITYRSGNKFEKWVFYENGLKDLPSLEFRVGLGYAIAANLLKDVDSIFAVKSSSMLDIAIEDLPKEVKFMIKNITYPEPPQPPKDVSHLKDW